MGEGSGDEGIAVRAAPCRMKCGTSKLLSIPSSASTHFGDSSCWYHGKRRRGSSWNPRRNGFLHRGQDESKDNVPSYSRTLANTASFVRNRTDQVHVIPAAGRRRSAECLRGASPFRRKGSWRCRPNTKGHHVVTACSPHPKQKHFQARRHRKLRGRRRTLCVSCVNAAVTVTSTYEFFPLKYSSLKKRRNAQSVSPPVAGRHGSLPDQRCTAGGASKLATICSRSQQHTRWWVGRRARRAPVGPSSLEVPSPALRSRRCPGDRNRPAISSERSLADETCLAESASNCATGLQSLTLDLRYLVHYCCSAASRPRVPWLPCLSHQAPAIFLRVSLASACSMPHHCGRPYCLCHFPSSLCPWTRLLQCSLADFRPRTSVLVPR